MKKAIGAATLEIIQGDITALEVDAIVNSANRFLSHGSGVAWAIVRKGGLAIEAESEAWISDHGSLNTGDAIILGGGTLPAKHVIHTVGPVWGEGGEESKLRRAIHNSLKVADSRQLKTIAFPAISTGLYHFPAERAAQTMLAEIKDYLSGQTGLQRVVLCLYDAPTYEVFLQAFNAL